jgi:hypothetical protein
METLALDEIIFFATVTSEDWPYDVAARARVDELIPLELATFTPEADGAFSVKQLRLAIQRGELQSETHANGRRISTTRQWVMEWRERCRSRIVSGRSPERSASPPEAPPTFGSESPGPTVPRSGSSCTRAHRSVALSAALAMSRRLSRS